MSIEPALVDQLQRSQVEGLLDETILLEAGAGSGKTTGLVSRVVKLVCEAEIPIQSIVAVTFTDKSALELSERVRTRLKAVVDDPSSSELQTLRAQAALSNLGSAPIGTIHSLCRRILSTFALESGLPPNFRIMDSIESDVDFDVRWRAFITTLLSGPQTANDPSTWAIPFLFGSNSGSLGNFPSIARSFEESWDRVASLAARPSRTKPDIGRMISSPLAALESKLYEAARNSGITAKGHERIQALIMLCSQIAQAQSTSSEYEIFDLLQSLPAPQIKMNQGKTANAVGRLVVEEALAALIDVRSAFIDDALQSCAGLLSKFTMEGVESRKIRGLLTYQDLVVLTLELTRSSNRSNMIIKRLQRRYRRVLVDEFQDTDPMQVEILVALGARIEAGDRNEPTLLEAGRLFFVGDPKQSIYRFRGADLASFTGMSKRVSDNRGMNIKLISNFRSQRHIVTWINSVFDEIMDPAIHGFTFTRLESTTEDTGPNPEVTLLRMDQTGSKSTANTTRVSEAIAVTEEIHALLRSELEIRDPTTSQLRRVTPGDIAVLSRTRTNLYALEYQLEAKGIDYVAESSSVTFKSPELYDITVTLEAIDDPSNELMVLTALRSTLFGCTDEQIAQYVVEKGRRLNYLLDLSYESDEVPEAISESLSWLAAAHRLSSRVNLFELIEHVMFARHSLSAAEFMQSPSQVRVRYGVYLEEARIWNATVSNPSLGRFLRWMRGRMDDQRRVSEPIDPTGQDAVRLMTIHAAKGLEFPVVFIVGLGQDQSTRSSTVAFVDDGSILISAGQAVRSSGWQEWVDAEKEADYAEGQRLIYVAATRARDRLIVSLFGRASTRGSSGRVNLATQIGEITDRIFGSSWETASGQTHPASKVRSADGRGKSPKPPVGTVQIDRARSRIAEIRSTLEFQNRRTFVSPSDFESVNDSDRLGARSTPFDTELTGQSGLDPRNQPVLVGVATHRVLQVIDLETATSADYSASMLQTAVSQACASALFRPHIQTVTDLVTSAVTSDLLRRVSPQRHWKETYFCVPLEGERFMEGYVDLIYEEDDLLHIVDYKTSASGSADLISVRSGQYGSQAMAYAYGLNLATGREVGSVTLLYLFERGSYEERIDAADYDFTKLLS